MKKGKVVGIILALVLLFYIVKSPEAASNAVANFLEMLSRWGANIAYFLTGTVEKVN